MTNSVYLKIKKINELHKENIDNEKKNINTRDIISKLEDEIASTKRQMNTIQGYIDDIGSSEVCAELTDIIREIAIQNRINPKDVKYIYSTGFDIKTMTPHYSQKITDEFNQEKAESTSEIPVMVLVDVPNSQFKHRSTSVRVRIGLQDKQLDGKTFAEHVHAESITTDNGIAKSYESKVIIDDLSKLMVRASIKDLISGTPEAGYVVKDAVSRAILDAADTYNRKNKLDDELTLGSGK